MSVYPVSSGSQAIQQGFKRLDHAAAQIARDSTTAASGNTEVSNASKLDKSLVDLKEASLQTQAGVKAVKAQDGMIGTLLDEYA